MPLKRNVAANFISQGWLVLMSFAFIPVYIRYLGVEAYGLVGFFISLQAWVAVIDLGLSMTLNREMARASTLAHGAAEARRLLGAVQLVYLVVGALLVVVVWNLGPVLAERWFRSATMSADVLRLSIRLLGLALVCRWASQIYRAAIQGLQRQVWLGFFTVASATLRSVGALVWLAWFNGDVIDFFAWQLGVSALELAVLVVRLRSYLPGSARAGRPSLAPLRGLWRFAGGVLIADLLAVVMTQSDKLILSRMLSLESFGYYSFAFTLGTAVAVFKTPVFQAVSPRLSADIASADAGRVADTYHKASQTMAVMVLPGAAVVLFNAHGLIRAWSGDGALADRSAALAAIFVAAYALNALVHVPAALALSSGWSGWGMVTNAVAALLIVPAVILATAHFGAIGAAASNLALNGLYFVVAVKFLHRRLLTSEWRAWFAHDCLSPMAAALLAAAALAPLMPDGTCRACTVLALGVAWVLVSAVVALTVAYPRAVVFDAAARLRPTRSRR